MNTNTSDQLLDLDTDYHVALTHRIKLPNGLVIVPRITASFSIDYHGQDFASDDYDADTASRIKSGETKVLCFSVTADYEAILQGQSYLGGVLFRFTRGEVEMTEKFLVQLIQEHELADDATQELRQKILKMFSSFTLNPGLVKKDHC